MYIYIYRKEIKTQLSMEWDIEVQCGVSSWGRSQAQAHTPNGDKHNLLAL